MFKKQLNERFWNKGVEQLKLLSKKGNDRLIQNEVSQELRRFAGQFDFVSFAAHSLAESQELLEQIDLN